MHRTHLHRTRKHSPSSAARLPRSNATTRTHLHPSLATRSSSHPSTRGGSNTQATQHARTRARMHESTLAHMHPARQSLPSGKRTHVRTHVCNHTPSKEIPASLCSCLAQSLTPQPKSLLLNAPTQGVAPPAPTLAAPNTAHRSLLQPALASWRQRLGPPAQADTLATIIKATTTRFDRSE